MQSSGVNINSFTGVATVVLAVILNWL